MRKTEVTLTLALSHLMGEGNRFGSSIGIGVGRGKAAEDSRTPRPGGILMRPNNSRERLGVRLSSAAFVFIETPHVVSYMYELGSLWHD